MKISRVLQLRSWLVNGFSQCVRMDVIQQILHLIGCGSSLSPSQPSFDMPKVGYEGD